MHRTIDQAKLPAALAQAALEELRTNPDQHAPRFPMTYCSQCGSEQGPGDCGVSHCSDHRLPNVLPYGSTRRAVYPEGLPTTNAAIAAELEVKRPTNPRQVKHWLRSLPPLQLLRAAQELADELAKLQGIGHQPQNGCFHVECHIGDADVLVEFEHEPSDGDGWNEPHVDESLEPLCALVNGVWVEADQFDSDVVERWTKAGWEHLQKLAEQDEEDRAAAQEAERRERCYD